VGRQVHVFSNAWQCHTGNEEWNYEQKILPLEIVGIFPMNVDKEYFKKVCHFCFLMHCVPRVVYEIFFS
jgi:hypothetical protein